MLSQKLPAFICLLILSGSPALHASQGEGDLGDIDFSNSGSPQAQPHFERAVLLLHSFEYEDARSEFLKAQDADPGFALAYWGEAMTYNHPLWRQQDKELALAALQKLGATPEQRLARAGTPRERGYLQAVEELYCEEDKARCDWRYFNAMRELSDQYPDDLEAAAFYALSLLGTAQGIRNVRTYMRAAAVAEEVFSRNPRHPGAVHYLIHSYDEPIHAPLGLRAARVYAEIAPGAPHALHMPSHIFMALGRWQDSIDSNTASARAALDRNSSGSAYHALWWKHYSLLQVGRFEEAARVLQTVEDLAGRDTSGAGRRHVAYMRASQVLETQAWDSNLLDDLDVSDLKVKTRAAVLFARGLQLVQQGLAQEALEQVRALKHLPDPEPSRVSDGPPVKMMANLLEGALLLRLAQHGQALRLVQRATRMETERAAEFGPPIPMKPAFEVLGDVLLALQRPAEAQDAYAESLLRNPGRWLSLMGMAMASAASGDRYSLTASVKALQANWKDGDPGLPALPEIPPESPGTAASPTASQPVNPGSIPNFSAAGDSIYFGGQPALEDVANLKALGIRTVINLRSEAEMEALTFDEARAVEEAGMGYLHFPVRSSEPPSSQPLEGLFDVLEDTGAQPVFLHCQSSNRSGYIWALFQGLRRGLETEEAIRMGEEAGLRSEGLKTRVRQALSERNR